MSTHSGILLLLSLASLQDGLSVPSPAQQPGVEGGIDVPVATHHRTKRCSCSSRLDSECHYFCHLDIIWINTPSKTTLYGLGNPAVRRRHPRAAAASRCSCSRAADRTCSHFCVHSINIQTPGGSQKHPQPSLLSILRGLADKVKDAVNPDTKNTFDDSETNVG